MEDLLGKLARIMASGIIAVNLAIVVMCGVGAVEGKGLVIGGSSSIHYFEDGSYVTVQGYSGCALDGSCRFPLSYRDGTGEGITFTGEAYDSDVAGDCGAKVIDKKLCNAHGYLYGGERGF